MIQDGSEVLEEVFRKYNKDPMGWYITLSSDRKNRSVVLIQKDKKVWQIKTHHITPYRNISLGGKAKAGGDVSPSMMSFGWRSLSPELFKRINSDMRKKGEVSTDILEEIANIDPKPIDETIKEVVGGPFNIVNNPVSSISKGQKKLDKKLSLELDRLLFKQEGSGMYG